LGHSIAWGCPQIFYANQSQFYLAYDRVCVNPWEGALHILSVDDETKMGDFWLACTAGSEGTFVVQLTDKDYTLAARTIPSRGSNGAMRTLLTDCDNNVVAQLNQVSTSIRVNGSLVDTQYSVYKNLGGFPVGYVSVQDYKDGLVILRDDEGYPKASVMAQQRSVGSCNYPQWLVTLEDPNDTSLLSDPKVISQVLANLVFAQNPYNSCVELSWRAFGLTCILPGFLAVVAVANRLLHWARERHVRLG
jgi:hypothetical protein